MSKRKRLSARAMDALTAALWNPALEHSRAPWFVIRLIRTLILAARDFNIRQGPLHASALTFYALLSLVPLAAMAFGVAKGFGFEQMLERELLTHFEAQKDVIQQVIAFARNMLDNTKGGLIAGVGVVVLFWSVIKVLGRIEDNFNLIWAVQSRSLARKLSDYLTIMIIGPVLLIMSGSATVFIASQVSRLSSQVGLEDMVGPAVTLGLLLAPYVLIWTLFTLLYLIMPNTRVRLGSSILGAILAGSTYQLLQVGYVRFQIGVSSYNAIYGSFAALPLFLVWLQLSWIIVLFGAEIVHAFPCSDVFEPKGEPQISVAQKRLLALAICHDIVRRFHRDEPALRATDLVREYNISHHQARAMLDVLIRAHLICEIQSNDDDSLLLQPARDSANITVHDVTSTLDNLDAHDNFPERHPKIAALYLCLQRLHIEMDASPSNALLRDIDPARCGVADTLPSAGINLQFCTKEFSIDPE